jgi:hypothetical protein
MRRRNLSQKCGRELLFVSWHKQPSPFCQRRLLHVGQLPPRVRAHAQSPQARHSCVKRAATRTALYGSTGAYVNAASAGKDWWDKAREKKARTLTCQTRTCLVLLGDGGGGHALRASHLISLSFTPTDFWQENLLALLALLDQLPMYLLHLLY